MRSMRSLHIQLHGAGGKETVTNSLDKAEVKSASEVPPTLKTASQVFAEDFSKGGKKQ